MLPRVSATKSEIKLAKNIGKNDIWGRFFCVNVVSLKYIGMIYINVGEMCRIPINVRVQWTVQWCSSAQMATPFACRFNIFYIFQVFILLFHKPLHPDPFLFLSLSVHLYISLSLFLWYTIPFLVVFPCGVEMLIFSSCNPKFFAVRHIFTIQWTHPVTISKLMR